MRSTRRIGLARGLAVGCVVLGFVGIFPGGASAVETHPFTGSFGPDGTDTTAFEQPGAVGVDQGTGAIYVADSAAGTVEKFDSTHKPALFSGISPNISGSRLTGFSFATSEPLNQLAVDSTSHGFYVVNHGSQSLRAFQADGEPALFTAGAAAGTNEIGGFAELCGVAVDANGDIYTGDYFQGVHVYAPSGELLATVSGEQTGCNLAVDSHGAVYVNQFESAVIKYTSSEFPVTPSVTYSSAGTVDQRLSTGVALDPVTARLFVDERTRIVEFDESGHHIGMDFGGSGAGALTRSEGIALNSAAGEVYATDVEGERRVGIFGPGVVLPTVVTGQASVAPTSVTVNGTVDPEGVELTECAFEYVEAEKYEPAAPNPYAAGATAPCSESASAIGSGTQPVAVHAELTGLHPGTTYHFRLRASNASGGETGDDATLATQPTPAITGESATNLTGTEVDLGALVNPGGLPLTRCVFEYGATGGSFEHEVSCSQALAQIGSGTSPVAISVHLDKLERDVAYHWRVVAANAAGTTTSSDHTFVYNTTTEGLPDGRAYEMVTPVHKNAALLGDIFQGAQPTVAEDGSRVILPTVQCFGEASSCSVNKGVAGTPYEFSRTSQGWAATELAPSAQQFEVSSAAKTNVNNGTALFDMPSPPNGQYDFYTRSPEGLFTDIGRVTADVTGPPGTKGPAQAAAILATGDLSHVVFGNEGHPMWPSFDETAREGASVYEYVAGQGNLRPELVGVSGGAGSESLLSICGTFEAAHNQPAQPDSLSADGRTVFFTPVLGCPGSGENVGHEVPAEGVYARVDGSETVDVSVRSGSDCTGECLQSEPAGAHFEGASLDGNKVFFTSTQQLTNNASEDIEGTQNIPTCRDIATANGCNLYLATLAPDSEHKTVVADLRALSAGDLSGNGPRAQGVMAVSNDGSRVYFVARGVLSGVTNGQGAVARDGGENLYVSEAGGPARFIATLAETTSDEAQWRGERANVTADGRFLLFTSQAPLTGDDLRGVGGAAQVFRYDAVTGALVRVSVGENGFNDNGNAGVGDAQVASVLFAREFTAGGAARTGPSLSADGSRVFFMSPVGLTRGALNDVRIGVDVVTGVQPEYAQNVYEYRDGHVYLISDGRDANVLPQTACTSPGTISAVCLLGTDASGGNVFFSSADQLVGGDTDSQVDVFDARVCTGSDPCVAPAAAPAVPCGGEACHGIPAGTPGVPGGGSATLSGAGNSVPAAPVRPRPATRAQQLAKALKACHRRYRHSKKRRKACERAAHKRFPAFGKARKSSYGGRAGR